MGICRVVEVAEDGLYRNVRANAIGTLPITQGQYILAHSMDALIPNHDAITQLVHSLIA